MRLFLNTSFNVELLIQAFSWMLIHSLWQGLLLAVVAAIFLQASKSASARLRYNIVFTLLALFMAVCGATFMYELAGTSRSMVQLPGVIGQNATQLLQLNVAGVQLFADACGTYISTHATWLVLLWTLFFAFRSFRLVRSVLWLQKARHQYTQVAAGWQERFELLCHRLQINRSVQLLASTFVKVPMVIGHLKPVILMPAGLLTGLPAEQIEAVLLHELAHIRRYDYLVNMLQTFCEAVFFFNPGMLWVSAMVRNEREHCCDDIALAQTGKKREFIEALISFKEHAVYAHHAAVAFPGKKNQLLQRVSRIIHNKNQSLATGEKVFFMTGVLLLSAVLFTAAVTQLRNIEAVPDNEQRAVSGYYYTASVKQEPVFSVRRIASGLHTDPIPAPDIAVKQRQPEAQAKLSLPSEEAVVVPDKVVAPATATQSCEQVKESKKMLMQAQAVWQQQPPRPEMMQVEKDRQQTLPDAVQADKDRVQAERDRQQAFRDREQAAKDRLRAEQDREQARLDRIQAEKDRLQADRDRIQADRDREQAIKDRAQADKDRQLAAKEREAAYHS